MEDQKDISIQKGVQEEQQVPTPGPSEAKPKTFSERLDETPLADKEKEIFRKNIEGRQKKTDQAPKPQS